MINTVCEVIEIRGDVIIRKNEQQIELVRVGAQRASFVLELDSAEFVATLIDGVASDSLRETERHLVDELISRGFAVIVPRTTTSALGSLQDRWAAHFGASPDAVGRLRASLVVILGCGGTGASVAQTLAAAGVGALRLIDHDLVTESNLNRQFPFGRMHLGQAKADVLAERLHVDYPESRTEAFARTIHTAADLLDTTRGASLIVCCADQPPGLIKAAAAIAAAQSNCAVLFGAVGLMSGTIGPLLVAPELLERYAEVQCKAADLSTQLLAPPSIPSNGATNTMVAALVALEAIKYLAGLRVRVRDRVYSVDFDGYGLSLLAKMH